MVLNISDARKLISCPENATPQEIVKLFIAKREYAYLRILEAPNEKIYNYYKRVLERLNEVIEVLLPEYEPEMMAIPDFDGKKEEKRFEEEKNKKEPNVSQSKDDHETEKSNNNEEDRKLPPKIPPSPKKIKTKWKSFLKIAVVVLAIISAYTTAEGFLAIWGEGSIIGSIIAWGFAIALSAVMVYCSINIPNYYQHNSIVGLVITFVLIATLSLIFNFNSIYPRLNFQLDRLHEELQQMKINFNKEYERAKPFISQRSGVDSLRSMSETALKDSLFEAKGIREDDKYTGIESEGNEAKRHGAKRESAIITAEKRLEKELSDINMINIEGERLYNLALDSRKKEKVREAIHKLWELTIKIGQSVKGKYGTYEIATINLKSNSKDPSATIRLLIKLITFSDALTPVERGDGFLSLFIAFLLDFPIFFILIFLYRDEEENMTSIDDMFSEVLPIDINIDKDGNGHLSQKSIQTLILEETADSYDEI